MVFTDVTWTTAHILLVLSLSIPIIAVIGAFWHASEKNRRENDLKQSMIERGLPVDQIERVMKLQGR